MPLSCMLHGIPEDDHMQWHIPLIRHYTNLWPCYQTGSYYRIRLFVQFWGFHRTFARAVTCQQRMLTPPNTWSCHTLRLVCVLMLRPISLKLVLFTNFWASNIPWYYILRYSILQCFHLTGTLATLVAKQPTTTCTTWLVTFLKFLNMKLN